MPVEASRFTSVCPVFVSQDVRRTVQFYTDMLGFKSAKHYDKVENFATVYRDAVEFVIVQAKQEGVKPASQLYGAENDAYIVTATPADVEPIFQEYKARGVKIVTEPHLTDYGSVEFVFEDCDGRQIGVGRIQDEAVYFKDSDFKP
jgi:catechol 2,3-dioxygenase-like lactoylglutathione lyase family enzyme